MFPIRFATVVSVLLTGTLCLGDEPAKEPVVSRGARSQLQPYVDWLPSASESLLVLEEPYQVPPEPGEDASFRSLSVDVFREIFLKQMFEGDAREALVGKRIQLWIEASSNFHFPIFPEDVRGVVDTIGVSMHYDGCHVIVFDQMTPPETRRLFAQLLRKHPAPTTLIPAPERHQIEGHEAIAWSTSPPDRSTPRSTAEQNLVIAAALSIRYWIASPKDNVLIVATSRAVLAETLRKFHEPDQRAFPETLEEWKHVSVEKPVWGMRHYRPEPTPGDMSDLRDDEGEGVSGFTFEIDAEADTGELTFLNCSHRTSQSLQRGILAYVYPRWHFTVGPHGRLVSHLDWSTESPDDEIEVEGNLVFWVYVHLGHAVTI